MITPLSKSALSLTDQDKSQAAISRHSLNVELGNYYPYDWKITHALIKTLGETQPSKWHFPITSL